MLGCETIGAKTQNSTPERRQIFCARIQLIFAKTSHAGAESGGCWTAVNLAWNMSLFSCLITQLTLLQEDGVCITCPLVVNMGRDGHARGPWHE